MGVHRIALPATTLIEHEPIGVEAYTPVPRDRIPLIVGPVGDLTESELRSARDASATIATFGPLTMGIDTACCAASAVVVAGSARTTGYAT